MNISAEVDEVMSYLHSAKERSEWLKMYADEPDKTLAQARAVLEYVEKMRSIGGVLIKPAKCDSAQAN